MAFGAVMMWLYIPESTATNVEKDEEPLRRRLIYNIDAADQKESPYFQEDFFLEEQDFGRELFMSQSASMSMSS